VEKKKKKKKMKGRRGVSPSASRPINAGEPLLLLVVVVV
jgi:hypothetical protein